MKLNECTYGTIVATEDGRVGMIVGITNNCPLEDIKVRSNLYNAIPLVRWSCGRESGIHAGNIFKFKG